MGLVNDDGVIAPEHWITLRLGQQNAVGHQLDRCLAAAAVLKTDLIAHPFTKWRIELLGDPPGHRTGRQAPRLGMTDHSLETAPQFKAYLG